MATPLINEINNRIKNNKNFVQIFIGPTGSGKSLAAVSLAETLNPDDFNIDRIVFDPKSFMNCINNLVERSEKGENCKGKVIVWDELGVTHSAREFMSISNRAINYFFQTCRHLNLIVFFTVPLLSFVDSNTRKLCHSYVLMTGINQTTKTSTAKVKIIQTNSVTGKLYPKRLRYNDHSGYGPGEVGSVKFSLPSKELLDAYEKKKKEFTTSLNKDILIRLGDKPNNESIKDESHIKLTALQEEIKEMRKIMTVKEIAAKKGIKPATVYTYLHRLEEKGCNIQTIRHKLCNKIGDVQEIMT